MRVQRPTHRRRNTRARQNRIHVHAPRLVDTNDIQFLQLTLRPRALQRIIAECRQRGRRLSALVLLLIVVVVVERKSRPFATECYAHGPARRREKGDHAQLLDALREYEYVVASDFSVDSGESARGSSHGEWGSGGCSEEDAHARRGLFPGSGLGYRRA
jgi:hypothetical protein